MPTEDDTQSAISPSSRSSSFRRLVALAREARVFAHRKHPTTIAEVNRFGRLATRSIGDVCGHDSEGMRRLVVLLNRAFRPWEEPSEYTVKDLNTPRHPGDVDLIQIFAPSAIRQLVSLLLETARRIREQPLGGASPAISGTIQEAPPETPKEVIDRLRGELGFTFAVLAGKADLAEKTIYRLCGGKNVKSDTRKAIADALGCDSGSLRWKHVKTNKKSRPKKSSK